MPLPVKASVSNEIMTTTNPTNIKKTCGLIQLNLEETPSLEKTNQACHLS
jgi:hypothetical protein